MRFGRGCRGNEFVLCAPPCSDIAESHIYQTGEPTQSSLIAGFRQLGTNDEMFVSSDVAGLN